MHKTFALVVVAWTAFVGSAWADDPAPSAPGERHLRSPDADAELLGPVPGDGRVDVDGSTRMTGAATFLLLPLGKGNGNDHLALAYGGGVSLSYTVIRGLSLGLAPQVLFNVMREADARKQYDLMARIAYAVRVTRRVALYGELLPGYSIISPRKGDSARGLVLAAGAGGAMDFTSRVFANASLGYQYGLQALRLDGTQYFERSSFVRVAVGGGMRF
jgi:hypothetical protein